MIQRVLKTWYMFSRAGTHHQNNALVVTLIASVHDGSRAKVPKATDDKKRADRGHSSPESLGQMKIPSYDASSNEQIEWYDKSYRIQGFREQLKVLCGALFVRRVQRGRGVEDVWLT